MISLLDQDIEVTPSLRAGAEVRGRAERDSTTCNNLGLNAMSSHSLC